MLSFKPLHHLWSWIPSPPSFTDSPAPDQHTSHPRGILKASKEAPSVCAQNVRFCHRSEDQEMAPGQYHRYEHEKVRNDDTCSPKLFLLRH